MRAKSEPWRVLKKLGVKQRKRVQNLNDGCCETYRDLQKLE